MAQKCLLPQLTIVNLEIDPWDPHGGRREDSYRLFSDLHEYPVMHSHTQRENKDVIEILTTRLGCRGKAERTSYTNFQEAG